jgi:hypothetical protein
MPLTSASASGECQLSGNLDADIQDGFRAGTGLNRRTSMLPRVSPDQHRPRWDIGQEWVEQRADGLCIEPALPFGHKCEFFMIAMRTAALLLYRMLACRLRIRMAMRHALHAAGSSGYDFLGTTADSADGSHGMRPQQQSQQDHGDDRATHLSHLTPDSNANTIPDG